jgi:hypothetical protein
VPRGSNLAMFGCGAFALETYLVTGGPMEVVLGLIWLGMIALGIWAAFDASRIPETVWVRASRSKSAWIAGLVLFPPAVIGYLGVREDLDAVRDRDSRGSKDAPRAALQPLAPEERDEERFEEAARRAQLNRLTERENRNRP